MYIVVWIASWAKCYIKCIQNHKCMLTKVANYLCTEFPTNPFSWHKRGHTHSLTCPLSEFYYPQFWKARETALFLIYLLLSKSLTKKKTTFFFFFQNKLFQCESRLPPPLRESILLLSCIAYKHKQMPVSKQFWFPSLAQGFEGKIKTVALYYLLF